MKIALTSATGTGRKRTLPALAASTVCKVAAIHGRDRTALEELASQFNIPHVYTDLELMAAERPFDVAMVCSPPFLHRDQAATMLNAGIPTFVEKPLALSAADAEFLISTAANAGTALGIAHHIRHHPAYEAIRAAVVAGRIGQIETATMEWSFKMNRGAPSSRWKLDAHLNGLTPFSDAGVHCLDVGIGLLGPGVVLSAAGSPPESGGGTRESCDVIADHGGVRVFYRASRLYGPFSNQLTISGTDGEIVAPRFFGESPNLHFDILDSDGTESVQVEAANPYQAEVEDFALRATKSDYIGVGTTPSEALAACRMIDDVSALLAQP